MFEIAAFGNPLLDITVKITSDELLKKYKLKEDDQIDVAESIIKSLFSDIKTYPNNISAGGCAQNTIRVLQWLLKKPNSTVYFGGIGNDDQGHILTELVENSGVTTKYLIDDNHSTGTCIALIKGTNRSLVAHLGAAEYYSINALNDSLGILKSIKICYVEGFFLIKRLEVSRYILDLCMTNKTTFVFNLCAPYLCHMYPKQVVEFAKSCNILFGNHNEFSALGKILSIDNPKKVAVMLNQTYESKELNNSVSRFGKIVLMTNGAKEIFCVYKEGNVLEFKVPKIPSENIQDTTGAGDSFVAGFLAALLMDFNLENCVKYGCWTAGQIVQQIGCTLPSFVPDAQNILVNENYT